MGLEEYKPELTEEELDYLEEMIDDCGGEEAWSLITQAVEIFRTCLFLALAFKALNQASITVPFVDELLNKHFTE